MTGTATTRRLGHGALHSVVLLVFATAFAVGTASRSGSSVDAPNLAPLVATAAGTFLVAAVLHAFVLRVLPGPRWVRNPAAVLVGGVAFGAVAVVVGVWSWPAAPTRVLGLGVVYGLFTTFVPLPLWAGAAVGSEPRPRP